MHRIFEFSRAQTSAARTRQTAQKLPAAALGMSLMRHVAILVAVAAALGALCLPRAKADQRSDYLIGLLRNSQTFRVRAQAAISLGQLGASQRGSTAIAGALGEALEDDHPAVRLAAAAAVETLGDPSVLNALSRARKDSDASVRKQVNRSIASLEALMRRTQPSRSAPQPGLQGQERYYVSVLQPGAAAVDTNAQTLSTMRNLVRERVVEIPGVTLAPANENARKAALTLRKRKLIGYAIDSSLVELDTSGDGVRAVVSVVLTTYPGRDIRAMLQGAARVPGMRGEEASAMAIEGALASAMGRMKQAMEASEERSLHVRR